MFRAEFTDSKAKIWDKYVNIDDKSIKQVKNISNMPFIYKYIAVMPDAHFGKGSTVGSVIPTIGAIIPASVGVDLGCGMCAVKTSLNANDLPDSLSNIRCEIERLVPHGRTNDGRKGDKGAWLNIPERSDESWKMLRDDFDKITERYPHLEKRNHRNHLGTLGTGNHFIEICLDEDNNVWIMLHSGSRGIGNAIGMFFIEQAKKEMERWYINLPDQDLSYLSEGSEYFNDYIFAVDWAQRFASENRKIMMEAAIKALSSDVKKDFKTDLMAVDCHHNYVSFDMKEYGTGKQIYLTRKGAVDAGKDKLGIIPGSMGAKSFIVKGLGNKDSFCSCSHGAGRVMSRNEAKRQVSLEEHLKDISHVECRKDKESIDETPRAYKNIDDVMKSQSDLVEVLHTLRQIVCVKGN